MGSSLVTLDLSNLPLTGAYAMNYKVTYRPRDTVVGVKLKMRMPSGALMSFISMPMCYFVNLG